MVGIEEDWAEADIDELSDVLSPDERLPDPEPGPEPEPKPDDGDDDDDESRGRPRRRRVSRIQRPVLVAILIGLAAGVVAAALLFSQTLPPPGTTASVLTRGCEPTTPTPSTVLVGSGPNHVVWSCTTAPTTGAFTVNGGGGSVTPTFTLGTGFTLLWIYPVATPPVLSDCSSATNDKMLTSGGTVIFNSSDAGQWNYCADYTTAPSSFGSMTVSWSQP